jgi:hypothetical protein
MTGLEYFGGFLQKEERNTNKKNKKIKNCSFLTNLQISPLTIPKLQYHTEILRIYNCFTLLQKKKEIQIKK